MSFFSESSLWKFEKRRILFAFIILFAGLLLTLVNSLFVKNGIEKYAKEEFEYACKEIKNKISARLNAHAQLLRSQAALFEEPQLITRDKWRNVCVRQMIESNLPGIQGVGYSVIIPPDELASHENKIRNEGFPEYSVKPAGKRDIYTSIIFLEPFSKMNLRAFGYDMFSEPVRREAMEKARDYNIPSLSAKIILVQETTTDVQAGTLMYVPVYKKGLPIETIEQRRLAIQGWVYSPYRMNDMMAGILNGYGNFNEKNIALEIYDCPSYNPGSMLYDSKKISGEKTGPSIALSFNESIDCNGRQWYLKFSKYGPHSSDLNYGAIWYTAVGGISVSFLLFILYISLISQSRSKLLAEELARELSASEKKYRDLIENSHDIIYTINTDGVLTFVSPSWSVLLGYPIDQVAGHSIYDFIHPDDIPVYKKWLNRGTESGKRQEEIEYRMKRERGDWCWYASSAVPLFEETGTVIGFEEISRDISERKRVEEALRISEERLQLTLNVSQIGIWDWDLKNDTWYTSPIYYGMLGYEAVSGLGDREIWIDRVHPDDKHMVEKNIQKVLSGESKDYQYEARLRHADGSYRWVKVIGHVVEWDNKNNPVRLIGIRLDITESKNAENKNKRMNEELKELNLAKDKLFSVIAHDLRSPFQGLLGLTEMMAVQSHEFSPSEMADFSKRLHDSVSSLYKLLENLLEWAELQKDSISFTPKELKLSEIFMKSTEAIRQNALQKEIVIQSEISNEHTIYADEKMVNSVLRNLLSNALKFSFRGGRVVVRSGSNDDGSIEISVTDNGVGISADLMGKLFKAGEKVRSAGTENEPSTGLGLLLCKEFVEKNGGKIWAESGEGKGSTFYFTLPALP